MARVLSIVSRFGPWVSQCCRLLERRFVPHKKAEDPRHRLGRQGEKAAARHLRRQGYKVLYRNYRARKGGELDIVCRHQETLVFVEVKTRATLEHGRPAEAVNLEKQHLITKGALAWLRLLHYPDVAFRFDIVEVIIAPDQPRRPACNVIQGAFTLPPPYRY